MVGEQTFSHAGLVNCAKLQLMLCCDQHWTFVDEGPCGLIFNVMSGISPLVEQLPVRNVQGVLVGFVVKDHFSKCADHSFVKSTLLPHDHSCNVSTVHQPLDREE